MATVIIPNTFVAGTAAVATQVNANFTAITDQLNGNLDADNYANNSVTSAKIRNSAAYSVVGRAGTTVGVVADIVATMGGTALVRGASGLEFGEAGTAGLANGAVTGAKLATAAVATVNLADAAVTEEKIGAGAVTNVKIGGSAVTTNKLVTASSTTTGVTDAKLRYSSAVSVIGRSAGTVGAPDDITAGSDGFVLRRSGTTLGFGTIVAAGIADAAVTNVKIASGVDAAKLTTGTLPIARIANGAVTPAKSSFFSTHSASAAIYAGKVAANGTGTRLPTDWGSSRNSEGTYTITHPLTTTDLVIMLTPSGTNAGLHFGSVNAFTVNTAFTVRFEDDKTGAVSDCPFDFMVIRY